MKAVECEYKKTQKCTEKYLDYIIRTRNTIKNSRPEYKAQTGVFSYSGGST